MSILSTHYGISEEDEVFSGTTDFQRTGDPQLRKDFAAKVNEVDEDVPSTAKKAKKNLAPEVSARVKTTTRRKDMAFKDKQYKRGAKGKTAGVAIPVCELKKIQKEMPTLEYRDKDIHGAFESPLQANQRRRAQRTCNSKPKQVRSASKQKAMQTAHEEIMEQAADEPVPTYYAAPGSTWK